MHGEAATDKKKCDAPRHLTRQPRHALTKGRWVASRWNGHDSTGHPRSLQPERTHHLVSFLMMAVALCGAVGQGASTWYSPPSLGDAEVVAEARFWRRLAGGHAEIFEGLIPASTPRGSAGILLEKSRALDCPRLCCLRG